MAFEAEDAFEQRVDGRGGGRIVAVVAARQPSRDARGGGEDVVDEVRGGEALLDAAARLDVEPAVVIMAGFMVLTLTADIINPINPWQ